MSKQTRGQAIFYGWFVVAAGFAATAVLGGLMSSFGVFFKPLETEFSWSRTIVSSGFTFFLIGYSISLAVSGRLADKYNPRQILLAATFLNSLGIVLCTWMNGIEQFRTFTLIAGLGAGAYFSVPASVVQRWFRNRRKAALALALIMSGFGVGQLIFTPLVDQFILGYGWRNTYLILGISFFAISIPFSIIIKPITIEASSPCNNQSVELTSTAGWSMGKALATPAYAGIIYSACIFVMSVQTINVHLVPYAIDLGMPSATAAAALGLVGGLSIPGRLASGFIGSKVGGQKALGLSLVVMAASLIFLLFLNATWMLYGFVSIFGAFSGIGIVVQWAILSEFFGLRSVGGLIGITSGISQLVGGAAPYVAGFIFDSTGSYFTSFIMMIVLLFSSGLVVMLMRKPKFIPE